MAKKGDNSVVPALLIGIPAWFLILKPLIDKNAEKNAQDSLGKLFGGGK